MRYTQPVRRSPLTLILLAFGIVLFCVVGGGLRSSPPKEIARMRTSLICRRVSSVEISSDGEVSNPVESSTIVFLP